jgi:hypothetical protein
VPGVHQPCGGAEEQLCGLLLEEFKRSYPALEVFVDELSSEMGARALPAIEAALGDAFVGAMPS